MEGVWKGRWIQLREAGLSYEQAKVVYHLLDEVHAFGFQWLSDSAWWALEDVYGEISVQK